MTMRMQRLLDEERAARQQVERLAGEQAALRRVAMLVAHGTPRDEIYAAVAEEIGRLLSADVVALLRYETDGTATLVGGWALSGIEIPLEGHMVLAREGVAATVQRSRQPAHVGHLDGPPGSVAAWLIGLGVQSGIGTPIIVEDELWGVAIVAARGSEALPAGTEARTAKFTDLVAIAIANAEARAQLHRIADQQAALRRVATLVARGAAPAEVFSAVAEEVGRVFPTVDHAVIGRYGVDRTVELVGGWRRDGDATLRGERLPLGGHNVTTLVFERGEPARVDHSGEDNDPLTVLARDLARSSAGAPIHVAGRPWGMISLGSSLAGGLPPGIELELAAFTEFVATAISNAQADEELRMVVEEQAALRRVATLVAGDAAPPAVFAAVAEEVGRILSVDGVSVVRFDDDDGETIVAGWSAAGGSSPPAGSRWRADPGGVSALVPETACAARFEQPSEQTSETALEHGVRSAVGAPIILDGRFWGFIDVWFSEEKPPPPDTEARLVDFTELMATAIANAQVRDELMESRARIVLSANEARRRIVRDLHDGAQQRLVHTIITLKLALRAQSQGEEQETAALVRDALDQAERANGELRQLAQGILPRVLSRGGLAAAVAELTTRSNVPTDVSVTTERFPADIEATAYFVVAEALTNVMKHSRATAAEVTVSVVDDALLVQVRDDGAGGASTDGGGLQGLADRVVALGGQLDCESPPGGGTRISVTLPLRSP